MEITDELIYQVLFNEGFRYLSDGEYDKAIAKFNKIIYDDNRKIKLDGYNTFKKIVLQGIEYRSYLYMYILCIYKKVLIKNNDDLLEVINRASKYGDKYIGSTKNDYLDHLNTIIKQHINPIELLLSLSNNNQKLKAENEDLKIQIDYSPDGLRYKEVKEHFESLVKES